MKKKEVILLIIALLLYQIGLALTVYEKVAIFGLIIICIAAIVYIFWLKVTKIRPYAYNPFKRNPNLNLKHRGLHIKIALTTVIGTFTYFQMSLFSKIQDSTYKDIDFSITKSAIVSFLSVWFLCKFLGTKAKED